jgi:hypothetical protein
MSRAVGLLKAWSTTAVNAGQECPPPLVKAHDHLPGRQSDYFAIYSKNEAQDPVKISFNEETDVSTSHQNMSPDPSSGPTCQQKVSKTTRTRRHRPARFNTNHQVHNT